LLLLLLGENAEALRLLREILAESPDDVDAIEDVACAMGVAEGIESEVAFLREEIARLGEAAPLRFRLAQALLSLGQWEEGWREYRWRPEPRLHEGQAPPEVLPDDLTGKRVLLLPNEGLGDMLFFLRFAEEIHRRGGRVMFQAPYKLAALLRPEKQIAEIVDSSDAPHDFWVGINELPIVLRARDVPASIRVHARADLRARWSETLAALGPPPYVGLTWRAGTDPRYNPEFGHLAKALFKEIDPALLAAMLRTVPGTFVALQRLPEAGEIEQFAAVAGRHLHDLSPVNDDLESMAALLSVLHDYVGVSNTNMHLRCALGGTAKVLVPFPPEWRWMATGSESPWFPGCRIYRQDTRRDWSAALQRLQADVGR
jgi:hypothetical protein